MLYKYLRSYNKVERFSLAQASFSLHADVLLSITDYVVCHLRLVMEQLLLSGRQCANVCLIFTGIDENRMNTERFFKAPPTSFEEALRRKLYIVVPAQQGGVREVD